MMIQTLGKIMHASCCKDMYQLDFASSTVLITVIASKFGKGCSSGTGMWLLACPLLFSLSSACPRPARSRIGGSPHPADLGHYAVVALKPHCLDFLLGRPSSSAAADESFSCACRRSNRTVFLPAHARMQPQHKHGRLAHKSGS